MHPLRHPRNAALVGIIFVVIGVALLGRPLLRRLARRLRRHDDADHPRRGDGADGLRPRRRLDGRVIRTASGRATQSPELT